ncbi:MAG: CapA family protein [Oscillospiraceae bacterium]|nr:CapA family protein [Oscillospiraceae bacterium]
MDKSKVSVVFTGDIGFDRYMDLKWEDEQLFSHSVLDFFHSADHVVANVEGALANLEDDGSRGFCFHSMNPQAACALHKIRADIWSLGNNHTLDGGREGLIGTFGTAKQWGCRTMGAGLDIREASEPVYLDGAGGIGLFCVSYTPDCVPAEADRPGCFRWDDFETIAARIAEIKQKCRWCVIVVHGGEEFACLPNPYTRDRYMRYLALGADAVIGHHPHVVENYELFENGKVIFYSLGNFVFDTDYQRAHLNTDVGVLLKLNFTEEKLDFEAVGIRIVRGEERIVTEELSAIFTHVPEEEYRLLIPLSAKAFLIDECCKVLYCDPDKFGRADNEAWKNYFFSETPYGYDKDSHMDWDVIIPLARQAQKGDWQNSCLEAVKEYILQTMQAGMRFISGKASAQWPQSRQEDIL